MFIYGTAEPVLFQNRVLTQTLKPLRLYQISCYSPLAPLPAGVERRG